MKAEKVNKPLKVLYPVVVEGKYDKIKLQSVIDGNIITTDGFSLMRDKKKLEYIRRLCEKNGKIIVFTDSDSGGLVIRNYLRTVLPAENVIHLYTPRIEGKEKRKAVPSKEGILGVEGIETEKLRSIFSDFLIEKSDKDRCAVDESGPVTKSEFFADGMSGGSGSRLKREALAEFLELPCNISANALLEAINLLGYEKKYRDFATKYRDMEKSEESKI